MTNFFHWFNWNEFYLYAEYFIFFIMLVIAHTWLKNDSILYKRIFWFSLFFAIVHITDCVFMRSFIELITPAFLVLMIILHNKSLIRTHLSPTRIFANETRKQSFWINDITKAHIYAHHSGKKMIIYIMKDEIACSLFRHSMILHMPLTHEFITLLINGTNQDLSLLIDSLGTLRSINPTAIDTAVPFLKQDVYFSCIFDQINKTFSLLHCDKHITHLSSLQLSAIIQDLLGTRKSGIDRIGNPCTL